MNAPDIDFRSLRKHRNSVNDGFEELTRQLVLADPPEGHTEIENRGPGADGGVEILVRFQGDRVWGWQSKFFDTGFGSSEVDQLKTSFVAAMKNYPGLERYYVAIPRNLSGSDEGSNSTQRRKWREFVAWTVKEATKELRQVEIVLWDDSEFTRMLQSNDPVYSGMRSYWFDEKALTQGWFDQKFAEAKERIGNRYLPDDHVDLGVRSVFDTLSRNAAFNTKMDTLQSKIELAKANCDRLLAQTSDGLNVHVRNFFNTLETLEKKLQVPVCSLDIPLGELASALGALKSLGIKNDSLSALVSDAYQRVLNKDEAETGTLNDWKYDAKIRHLVDQVEGYIATARQMFSQSDVSLLANRHLLVLGEAGSGKSHLLADEIRRLLDEVSPSLFLPARALQNAGKPDNSILEFLDCADWKFDVLLGALSAAAYAADCYAVIAVDGINESIDAAEWQSTLPALIKQISRYPNIKLIVSCRTDFQRLCIRDDIDMTVVHHPGFRGSLSEAAKRFLDNHGIERSSAPIFELSEVLNNPLFLSVVVRGLKREGKRSFPQELDSLPRILEYWLESVERSLIDSRYDRLTLGDGKLGRIVRELASVMAENGQEQLPFDTASEISERIIGLGPPLKARDVVVLRMIEEGLLLDFPSDACPSGKTISFSFQKFGDYFIAESILSAAGDVSALAKSLAPGGKYSHIFDREKRWHFEGIRIALLALCPGRFGVELPFLTPDFSNLVPVQVEDFVSSIPLRDSQAFTELTVETLENLRKPSDSTSQRPLDDRVWYSLLTKLATIPSVIINARYLKQHLEVMSLAERDATWSCYLVFSLNADDDEDYYSPVHQLVDWAWNSPAQKIDSERVCLAATTLALMTSTIDRSVRDRATKALASLFVKYPMGIEQTIEAFAYWDDSYVRERIMAASLAGALSCQDSVVLEGIAKATDKMIFSKTPVEKHAQTRRYGQLIIDHAKRHATELDDAVVQRSKPPYRSASIQSWPTVLDTMQHREEASSIFHSVVGYVSEPIEDYSPTIVGDFGNYTMGCIDGHFSMEPRSSKPPKTRRDNIVTLFKEVRALSVDTSAKLDELIAADQAMVSHNDKLFAAFLDEESYDGSRGVRESTSSEVDEQLLEQNREESEVQLMEALPANLRSRYKQVRPFDQYRLDEPPTFPLSTARAWLLVRCIELGWSRDLHEKLENSLTSYAYGRRDHGVERIGKKYQHIAFQELIGHLADHHWFLDHEIQPVVLQMLERFRRPDIDPTFLAGSYSHASEGYDPGGLCKPELYFEPTSNDENIAWAKTTADLPDLCSLFVQRGNDGSDWCIVRSFARNSDYMKVFDSAEPMRNGQLSIEMVLIPPERIAELAKLDLQALKDSQHDIFSHESSTEELFGLRSCHSYKGEDVQFETPYTVGGVPFGRISDTYSAKYSDYDQSGVANEAEIFTPKPSLLASLCLRPKDNFSRVFVDEADCPAFVDGSEWLNDWCIMRFDLIKAFAESQNLIVCWRVWFEKDGGLGSQANDPLQETFVRNDYIGYYSCEDGTWRGELVPFRE